MTHVDFQVLTRSGRPRLQLQTKVGVESSRSCGAVEKLTQIMIKTIIMSLWLWKKERLNWYFQKIYIYSPFDKYWSFDKINIEVTIRYFEKKCFYKVKWSPSDNYKFSVSLSQVFDVYIRWYKLSKSLIFIKSMNLFGIWNYF